MTDASNTLIAECKRQEESCLYTSTALFEWLKSLRLWKRVFILAPIILGALATWPLFNDRSDFQWITGTCALLAGLSPAIYKGLDLDVSLDVVTKHAHLFKVLQDRFRVAWTVTALASSADFRKEFDALMNRMDEARSSSLTPPERFFEKARVKIQAGHYDFTVDTKDQKLS
ncbi:MAG: hypothetical protein MRJ68_19280 [Nitrospira sp.]|nr:hypothetical protein [Nitrospira sp.]